MSKKEDDKTYFNALINESREKRISDFEGYYDISDIEVDICDFYYKITKSLQKNMADEWGRENCKKEKELLEDMLSVRCSILDYHFVWTDYYKKQLLELNKKIMNSFSMAYEEAKAQFRILKERINLNDSYINGFNIEIKLIPFILEPDEKGNFILNEKDSIYQILLDMLPASLWAEIAYYEHDDIDNLKPRKYEEDGTNYAVHFGIENFDDGFICKAMYDLYNNSRNILAWYDFLKINEIWAEVKVTHQHFIEDIGKGVFWDICLQSLSDNEAENYRQVYMSLLSKNVTGLASHLFVDEMNCWEKIGPFKRIKFQGNKADKTDWKKLYSMSIEENPRVLVKDAQIDLTDDELRQIKNFVSKNREALISIGEGVTDLSDFSKNLDHWKE